MGHTNKIPRLRALVIGLDGATYRLLRPLLQEHCLANLARMLREGTSGILRSTVQPSSEQAWATFMTGQNNGKHGVFGFLHRRPGTYHFDYVNGRSIRAPTLWRLLSQRGRDMVVINVPMTYPPQEVRGVLVAGLLSPGVHSRFTHPDGLYRELRQACGDYMIDVDIERGRLNDAQLAQLADDAVRMIRLRTCATLHLARTRPWDLLMVVYGASDRLAHKFWKYWDPTHRLHTPQGAAKFGDVLPRVYRELDAAVGELLDALVDERTVVFILSDHGFGPMEKAVYLNRWLAQHGYLALKPPVTLSPRQQAMVALRAGLRRAVRSLDNPLVARAKTWAFARFPGLKGTLYSSMAFARVDWSRTRAYALGTMGNIYLNLKGREPEGTVAPGAEAETLAEHLIDELHTLSDPETGRPVFHTIYRGPDLYEGPYAVEGPDIVCVKDSHYHVVTADWRDGDEIVVPLGEGLHFVSDQSGQHDLDGVLIAWGPGIRKGHQVQGARLLDMAATILYVLGEPIPADMDSRVLTDLFEPHLLNTRPPRYAREEREEVALSWDCGYTAEEEAAVEEHLTGLGYLD